jgi:hypothetical protein
VKEINSLFLLISKGNITALVLVNVAICIPFNVHDELCLQCDSSGWERFDFFIHPLCKERTEVLVDSLNPYAFGLGRCCSELVQSLQRLKYSSGISPDCISLKETRAASIQTSVSY